MIDPFLMNGLSHHNDLGESTSVFMGIRSDFEFLFHSSMKILKANRIAPDGTPRSGAILFACSVKKDARLIRAQDNGYHRLKLLIS